MPDSPRGFSQVVVDLASRLRSGDGPGHASSGGSGAAPPPSRPPSETAKKRTGLSRAIIEDIGRSGLDARDARAMHLEPVPDYPLPGRRRDASPVRAYRIPYLDLDGQPYPESEKAWRVRILDEVYLSFGDRKPLRYHGPEASIPRLYLPPLKVGWRSIAPAASKDLWIVEGEKKAARLARLVPAIGVGGVWNFTSRKADIVLIPDFEKFELANRNIIICYDSDLRTNPDVQRGLKALASRLVQRGARPKMVFLPDTAGNGKVGIDDYLENIRQGGGDEAAAVTALVETAEEFDLSSKLWDFNERYAYIRSLGAFADVSIHPPNILGGKSKLLDDSGRMTHITMGAKGAPVVQPIATTWYNWAFRREHLRLVYEPGLGPHPDGCLNTWREGTPPEADAPMDRWSEFLTNLIPVDAERTYVENWIAYQLQYPGTKLSVAVVLMGVEQGSGKSMLGHTIRLLFGRNGAEISASELYGSFNEWAREKQFILGEEIFSIKRREVADKLKNLITQEHVTINLKGVRQFTVRDCINYFFTTNHPDALSLEGGDRRFFVVGVPFGAKRKPEFYKRFLRWRDQENGLGALVRYFRAMDISKFNPYAPAPSTEAREQMVALSQPPLEGWVREFLSDPEPWLDRLGDRGRGDIVTANDLLRDYAELHPTAKTAEYSVNSIGRVLARMHVPMRRHSTGRFYCIRNVNDWRIKDTGKWREHHMETRFRFYPKSLRSPAHSEGKKKKF